MKRAAASELDAALADAERAAKRQRVTEQQQQPRPRQFEDVADIPELLTKIFFAAEEPLPLLISNYTQADATLTRTAWGIQRVNYLWYAACLHLFRRQMPGKPLMPPLAVCARWLRGVSPSPTPADKSITGMSPFRAPLFVDAVELVAGGSSDMDATMSVREMADAMGGGRGGALHRLLLFRNIWQSIYTVCSAAVTAAHGFYFTLRRQIHHSIPVHFSFGLEQPTLDAEFNDAVAEAAAEQIEHDRAHKSVGLVDTWVARWLRYIGIGPTNARLLGTAPSSSVPDDAHWIQFNPGGRIREWHGHVSIGRDTTRRLDVHALEPVGTHATTYVNTRARVRVSFTSYDGTAQVPMGDAGTLQHIIDAGQDGVAVDLGDGFARLRIRASSIARDAAAKRELTTTGRLRNPTLALLMLKDDEHYETLDIWMWTLGIVGGEGGMTRSGLASMEYVVEYLDIWRALALDLKHLAIDQQLRPWEDAGRLYGTSSPMRKRFLDHVISALIRFFGQRKDNSNIDARRYAALFSDELANTPNDDYFNEATADFNAWLLPPDASSPVLVGDKRERSATMFEHPSPSDT
jgi:hypothetical protein